MWQYQRVLNFDARERLIMGFRKKNTIFAGLQLFKHILFTSALLLRLMKLAQAAKVCVLQTTFTRIVQR